MREASSTRRRLVSPKDVARAAKGLNYVYGLSPSARRVGLALLDHLNVYNARCDPGESRLAAMLGLSERAIRKAKAELKQVGFLTWKSHGGLPLTADYRLNFKVLHATCDRIEADAKSLVPRRRRGAYRNDCSGLGESAQTGTSVPQTGTPVPPNYSIELSKEALKE
jgi:hypothetical protein